MAKTPAHAPDTEGPAEDPVRSRLSKLAVNVVSAAGSAVMMVVAVFMVVVWVVVGLTVGFEEHWMSVLVGVSGSVTFVMVFFIQHTTDRQLRAVLLKLDELIHTQPQAHDELVAAEDQPLHEQERLEEELKEDASKASTGRAR
ncbi:low affinity iron permease family protein [Phytomonospora sp. NPDC050363]|uniref:low affinity iron permease family protein n=1 Tax=Phytomonospora sp. NPDC050363 TaxID=3155642 RepID=UPI0033C9D514